MLRSVHLPVMPPVAPMLAKLVREVPVGDYWYEPKWDYFRSATASSHHQACRPTLGVDLVP